MTGGTAAERLAALRSELDRYSKLLAKAAKDHRYFAGKVAEVEDILEAAERESAAPALAS